MRLDRPVGTPDCRVGPARLYRARHRARPPRRPRAGSAVGSPSWPRAISDRAADRSTNATSLSPLASRRRYWPSPQGAQRPKVRLGHFPHRSVTRLIHAHDLAAGVEFEHAEPDGTRSRGAVRRSRSTGKSPRLPGTTAPRTPGVPARLPVRPACPTDRTGTVTTPWSPSACPCRCCGGPNRVAWHCPPVKGNACSRPVS